MYVKENVSSARIGHVIIIQPLKPSKKNSNPAMKCGPRLGAVKPKDVILLLDTDVGEFPVYWIHYACWLAVVHESLQGISNTLGGSSTCLYPETEITSITALDFERTSLYLFLIQKVKERSKGVLPLE